MAGAGEATRPERAAHARQLIGPVRDQDGVAQPVADGGRRVLHVELERRPAGHGAVDPAVIDAEVLGHRHRVVDHHAAAAGGDVAVDVGLGHAAVGQRPLQSLHVVLDAVQVRHPRVVGQPRADDDWSAVAHRRTRSRAITNRPSASAVSSSPCQIEPRVVILRPLRPSVRASTRSSVRNGVVHELYYYCTICDIESVSPAPCACCQGPVELIEKPLRAAR